MGLIPMEYGDKLVIESTVPTAGSSSTVALPTGTTMADFVISSIMVNKWTRWYPEAICRASFGVFADLMTTGIEITSEYESGKYLYDAAGNPIRILLIRV